MWWKKSIFLRLRVKWGEIGMAKKHKMIKKQKHVVLRSASILEQWWPRIGGTEWIYENPHYIKHPERNGQSIF